MSSPTLPPSLQVLGDFLEELGMKEGTEGTTLLVQWLEAHGPLALQVVSQLQLVGPWVFHFSPAVRRSQHSGELIYTESSPKVDCIRSASALLLATGQEVATVVPQVFTAEGGRSSTQWRWHVAPKGRSWDEIWGRTDTLEEGLYEAEQVIAGEGWRMIPTTLPWSLGGSDRVEGSVPLPRARRSS